MGFYMENVIVTGGCGFIGSNFIRLLLELDYNVICIDKLTYAGNKTNLPKDVKLYDYDIADELDMEVVFKQYKPKYIVHFAAESHVDRSIESAYPFIHTNILGTFNLIETAKKHLTDYRFIHVSTDEVYGSIKEPDAFTEESPYKPNSPYSASKASSDMLCRSYFKTYGSPIMITNCSNNYGAYQYPEKLIPTIIQKTLNGEPVPVYGNGNNVRDWIYVEDHCKAILSVMENGTLGETYNIGASCTKTNLEIVEAISNVLKDMNGEGCSIEYVNDRAGHDFRYAIDSSKIMNELNWSPQVSFDNGIRLTVEWYLQNQEWIADITNRKSGMLSTENLNERRRGTEPKETTPTKTEENKN
jgi:dTDP-glucose 4,6-dehydratase